VSATFLANAARLRLVGHTRNATSQESVIRSISSSLRRCSSSKFTVCCCQYSLICHSLHFYSPTILLRLSFAAWKTMQIMMSSQPRLEKDPTAGGDDPWAGAKNRQAALTRQSLRWSTSINTLTHRTDSAASRRDPMCSNKSKSTSSGIASTRFNNWSAFWLPIWSDCHRTGLSVHKKD